MSSIIFVRSSEEKELLSCLGGVRDLVIGVAVQGGQPNRFQLLGVMVVDIDENEPPVKLLLGGETGMDKDLFPKSFRKVGVEIALGVSRHMLEHAKATGSVPRNVEEMFGLVRQIGTHIDLLIPRRQRTSSVWG